MAGSKRTLTIFDGTIIELRLRDGWSVRAVATAFNWSPGTISDEIKRHSAAAGYLDNAQPFF